MIRGAVFGAARCFAGVLGVVLGVLSCVQKPLIDPISESGLGSSHVILNLMSPHGFEISSSRSMSAFQESLVEELHVLIFGAGGEFVSVTEGIKTGDLGNKFRIEMPDGNVGDEFDFVLLANSGEIIETTLNTDLEELTHDQITTLLTHQIDDSWYSSSGSIPMWGMMNGVALKAGSQEFTMQLLRAVARIDVGVGANPEHTPEADYPWAWHGKNPDGEDIPFELAEVIIMRPNNRYALIPATANFADNKVNNPTIPASVSAYSLEESVVKFCYNVDNKLFTTQDIYIPEAVVAGVGQNDRMAIIAGGFYNNSAQISYYRVDFVRNGELQNVLRNHLYRFDITRVNGAGKDTPMAAYMAATSSEMETQVTDWGLEEMDEVVLGEFFCEIESSSLDFDASAQGESKQIAIETDYKGVYIQSEADKSVKIAVGENYESPLGYKYELKKQPIVTRNSDNETYTLTVTRMQKNVTFLPSNNTERWLIRAGNVTKIFKVSQKWQQADQYQGNLLLAPPGVIGITENGKLTLRGSMHYAGTIVEKNSQFGPLESQPVYILYFTFNSLIGTYCTEGNNKEINSLKDIVWAPNEYNIENLKAQDQEQIWKYEYDYKDTSRPSLVFSQNSITHDPQQGYGDPCTYADKGTAKETTWHTPNSKIDIENWKEPLNNPQKVTINASGTQIEAIASIDWKIVLPLAGVINDSFAHFTENQQTAMYWSIEK